MFPCRLSSRTHLLHAAIAGLLGNEAFVMTLAAQRGFSSVDDSWRLCLSRSLYRYR